MRAFRRRLRQLPDHRRNAHAVRTDFISAVDQSCAHLLHDTQYIKPAQALRPDSTPSRHLYISGPIVERYEVVEKIMQSLDKPDAEPDRVWAEEALHMGGRAMKGG